MPPPPPPRRRGSGPVLAVGVVLVLLAALALAWRPVTGWVEEATAPCGVVVDGERIALDLEQAQAATGAAATGGPGEGIPEGVVVAVREAREDSALTCRATAPDVAAQEPTTSGLTPRAQTVLDELRGTFGDLPTGGYAPVGVDSGHGDDSTHYDGRAVDVFFRPVTEDNLDRGWVLAQWLVAHAEELSVQYVIFDDHYWGVRESGRGWQDYRVPGGSDDPVLRHLDHVHVDVVRGTSS